MTVPVLPLALPTLTVDVVGVPISQGSKSARVVGKGRAARAQLYDDNAKQLHPWRKKITEAAQARMRLEGWATLDGPVDVRIDFWMPRPPSVKREWPCVRPDADKLARACLDSLTVAAVYRDDAQVVHLNVWQRYAITTCGARIIVRPVT